MAEIPQKLRPDRDLQCYFERPSAIAAMSGATSEGFTVSGCWRQQFDWAVIEWNRDNVFEHPMFRNLPDGDLSGLTLSYEDTRQNAMALDSDISPTVDWPYLRIWAESEQGEALYKVRLLDHATAIEGQYQCATAEFELQGAPTTDDNVGLFWLSEHHYAPVYYNSTLETLVQAIVDSVNSFSTTMRASRHERRITLTYVGEGQTLETSKVGASGNRIGIYGFVSGAATESWSPQWQRLSGGTSPTKWRIYLDFSRLKDIDETGEQTIPTTAVRKMRWTYAADFQVGEFQRSEFQVSVSNWAVSGTGRTYSIAGPGSRRIEDDDAVIQYTGTWDSGKGNFSGGSISFCTTSASSFTCTYQSPQSHRLFLGTRLCANGAQISIVIDNATAHPENLLLAGEDVLTRLPLGDLGPGTHSLTVSHQGQDGQYFYFDFLEIAIPATTLPECPADTCLALATDWDTDHSISLAAERAAWLIGALGFHGRTNHYAGALWFYELVRAGHQYASATVQFAGIPQFSAVTTIQIGWPDQTPEQYLTLSHLTMIGDTLESIAKAFELEINRGYTGIRAEVQGSMLTIYARAMGAEGNAIIILTDPASGPFTAHASGDTLSGGTDGDWRVDLEAMPRLNRAARDWSLAFFSALNGYGLDAVASFSMELQHGDPAPAAGIAQRYPSGAPVLLNTPALQTNFSPQSLAFWRQVYLDMADVMSAAGLRPYLQFGEVQWWYFASEGSGMPYYDQYTKDQFRSAYGRDLQVITDPSADPVLYAEELQFLPGLIGAFTDAVMTFVRATHSNCRFEVLYPPDVNHTALNRAVNFPQAHWTAETLDCLKTESFSYTLSRDLNLSRASMQFSVDQGFPNHQRNHLVGISDATTAWQKEVGLARSEGVEAVVLFALDQLCLIGYPCPLPESIRRSTFQG